MVKSECPNSLVRAALCRAQFKMDKNREKNSMKLLCLTANLIFKRHYSSYSPIFFNGLKQSGKYREDILDGLWNYQIVNSTMEETFNQWLTKQSSSCSICSFFTSNKTLANNFSSPSTVRSLLLSEICDSNHQDTSNELLQCSMCHISVHRDCYENLCLALNADINNEYEPWLCQRCSVKFQVRHSLH